MKILLVPDSFKSTLSSTQICNIISGELSDLPGIEVINLPQSDGGEGALEAISLLSNLTKINCNVSDPLGRTIQATYLINKNQAEAYIESARAYGLTLLRENERNCMLSSSFGVGELVKHSINLGAKRITVFIGGSAGNDAGTGFCSALGFKFCDQETNTLQANGFNLQNITDIDDSEYIYKNSDINITAAVDVNNSFYGTEGAAKTYGKQKGADQEDIEILDKGLKNFASVILEKYNINLQNVPGSGAAGGLAGGIYALLRGKIQSGADIISGLTGLENKIADSDLIISGEGKIDSQTLNNKLVKKVCDYSGIQNKPVWTVCGYLEGDRKLLQKIGINKNFSMALTEDKIIQAISNPEKFLIKTCQLIKQEILTRFY